MMSFPYFPQHDAMDCGPACLRMISRYHGRFYSLESLKEKTGLTRDGVSLLSLSETADSIGLRATGVSISFDELLQAPLPCIVHWNQAHFVVVYDIVKRRGKTRVLVADPGAGKQQYSQEEFCRCWLNGYQKNRDTGIALLLEPSPSFFEHEDEKSVGGSFSFLFSYLKPYRRLLLQLLAGLLLGSFLQLLLPFLTQSVVDRGITHQNISFVYLVLIAQLVLVVSQSVVEFIRGWILLHMGTRVNIALVSDFLSKLMRLPMSYFDTKMTGDILQRINDQKRIQQYLTNSSLAVLFSVFNIFLFSLVLLFYDLRIFAVYLSGTVLYVLWVSLFMKKRAELDHKSFAQYATHQSSIVQMVTGMHEIKLNACEQQKRWEWEGIQARLFRLRVKGLMLSQYQDSGALLINQTKNIVITAFVAKLVIDGHMTLGMMLAVQYIIGQLNSPVDQLVGFARETQDAKLSLERLKEVQDKQDEVPDAGFQLREIPRNKGLSLREVSFAYDQNSEGTRVVDHVSFDIPAGKQTAIVGVSGSGKTTLIRLLLGFYPLNHGAVFLGEHKLNQYDVRAWRKTCGVVMQDGFIFSDTVARNIAPADEVIDKQRLFYAVKLANISDFIDDLPLGYQTKIGNDGHGLSQGQKQRILIARAVYKNPEFVFLDEATNALDANNESAVMRSLSDFLKGRTSVVVAHRLSTVRHADQIIVLEKGRVAETGTHDELIALQGAYYRLVKQQLDL